MGAEQVPGGIEMLRQDLGELLQDLPLPAAGDGLDPELPLVEKSEPDTDHLGKFCVDTGFGVLLFGGIVFMVLPFFIPELSCRFTQIFVPVYQRNGFYIQKKDLVDVFMLHKRILL
jgi:hypothetical protein